MRILLVSPKRPLSENEALLSVPGQSLGRDDFYSGAGVGLLVVGALTPSDIEVELVDEEFDAIPFDRTYDVVALSAMTSQAQRAYEIAAAFRASGSKVIIGGIHATLLPDEAREHCDSVVIGEAEDTWPLVIEDLRRGRLEPVYAAQAPCDLIGSPIPRYELLQGKRKKYWVNTSRGCPYSCNFCCSSNIFGKKYRNKSVDQIMGEVRTILAAHGKVKPQLICFADDNMLVDRERAWEIAGRLAPLKVRWFAQTDISIAEDEELLRHLKDSGCGILFIGFETLSRSALRALGNPMKAKSVDKYAPAIAKIQSFGIGVMGAFIVGLDDDDVTSFDRITRFIIDNRLYASQIAILTPLPGTQLRETLAEQERLLPTDWSRYNMTEVNYIPKQMTGPELDEGWRRVYTDVNAPTVLAEKKKHFIKLALQYSASRRASV